MSIELVKGDITNIAVDAVVNCTTPKVFIGGGSLDKALHKAAGPDLLKECRELMNEKKAIAIGECIATKAYKLPCRRVLHTAPPVYMGGSWKEAEHLEKCYTNAFICAKVFGLKSIAFPNIGCGAHCYPKKEAAGIAIAAAKRFLDDLQKIIFVCFEEDNYHVYKEMLGT